MYCSSLKLLIASSFLFGAIALGSANAAVNSAEKVYEVIRDLDDEGQELAIRAVLRNNLNSRFTLQQWKEIRKILHRSQKVGFDLIFFWDDVGKKRFFRKLTKIEKYIKRADQLMLKKNFAKSLKYYLAAAKVVRTQIVSEDNKEHEVLYYKLLHNIARALFGKKDFLRAVEVYRLIPSEYFQYKQVLYEKMWAAFRAKRYDIALGAIASQRSTFLSEFLDPESYLVQLYIYKRLCRNDELKIVIDSLKQYLKVLESGRYGFEAWAQETIETRALLILLEESDLEDNDLLTKKDLESEKVRIRNSLIRKYKIVRSQRIKRLHRVLGYSRLAILEKTPSLKRISDLEDPELLRANGYEYWPVSDTEEWIDELGLHLFVGESQCQ